MVQSLKLKKILVTGSSSRFCKYLKEDLTEYKIPKSTDLIISFYTLQFISPSVRQDLVNKILIR